MVMVWTAKKLFAGASASLGRNRDKDKKKLTRTCEKKPRTDLRQAERKNGLAKGSHRGKVQYYQKSSSTSLLIIYLFKVSYHEEGKNFTTVDRLLTGHFY